MQERWKVCQFLDRGDLSYRDIQKATKASLITIGRVSRFLKEENYHEYRTILQKIKKVKILFFQELIKTADKILAIIAH